MITICWIQESPKYIVEKMKNSQSYGDMQQLKHVIATIANSNKRNLPKEFNVIIDK